MKLSKNSLFGILMRARWWVSALVALGVFGVLRLALPEGVALFAALPFGVIAGMVAWKEVRRPRGSRLERAVAELRAMPWEVFAAALQAGLAREGFSVKRIDGAADFELERSGQLSLLCARRWKAATTGIEPIKDLAAAGERRGAGECLYAAVGELTENARAFSTEKKVRLMEGEALVKLVHR